MPLYNIGRAAGGTRRKSLSYPPAAPGAAGTGGPPCRARNEAGPGGRPGPRGRGSAGAAHGQAVGVMKETLVAGVQTGDATVPGMKMAWEPSTEEQQPDRPPKE